MFLVNNGGHKAIIAETSCREQNLLKFYKTEEGCDFTTSLNYSYELVKNHGFLSIVPELGGGVDVGCLLR